MTRSLRDNEREVLARLLTAEGVPGAAALVMQIERTQVVGGPPTFLEFAVGDAAPRSTCPNGPVPVRAFVEDGQGNPLGEVLVWIEDGYLSALEYAWTTDDAPTGIPTPDQLQLS